MMKSPPQDSSFEMEINGVFVARFELEGVMLPPSPEGWRSVSHFSFHTGEDAHAAARTSRRSRRPHRS